MKFDSLGRLRRPSQDLGLRPMYPLLPPGTRSRSVRLAMSLAAWAKLEHMVANAGVSGPRALGAVLERALVRESRVVDWQEWQIRKEQQLLRPA